MNRFVWLTADIGSGAMLTESQHLLVVSSDHDITWYRVATVDRESIQVSSVCSLTAAHVSSEILRGTSMLWNLWCAVSGAYKH